MYMANQLGVRGRVLYSQGYGGFFSPTQIGLDKHLEKEKNKKYRFSSN